MSGCPSTEREGTVAGESAGLLNLWRGISSGMESGYMAAKAIEG
jgi:flavin-dependent dehydrogenase